MPDDRPPWRCETCKWWDQTENLTHPRARYHDYGFCAVLSEAGEAYQMDSLIDVSRLSDSEAWHLPYIDTHRDFGCVHWEERDA